MAPTPEDEIELKAAASAWFHELRDRLCAAFEAIEDAYAKEAGGAPGRFERTETKRAHADDPEPDQGGGVMSVMRGQVFEKVGVNVSTVYGRLAAPALAALTARKEIPGLAEDPRFWASGISLVAHLANPRAPAAHMNTRLFWTPAGAWFGGGGDLNPTIPRDDPAYAEDAEAFHAAFRAACDAYDPEAYAAYKAWADAYFEIRHWGEARGAGGVFYDDLDSGDRQADFAFTQAIGRAFLEAYPPLVARRMRAPFTEDDRAYQLFRRGRYAEFNLVYDRGTRFGLETGHNPHAVLMSLPPLAAWP